MCLHMPFKTFKFQLDSATGQKIWSFDKLESDRSGFESVQFTEDGGFIVGGFKNSGLIPMPTFKSGGQDQIENFIFKP